LEDQFGNVWFGTDNLDGSILFLVTGPYYAGAFPIEKTYRRQKAFLPFLRKTLYFLYKRAPNQVTAHPDIGQGN